MTGTLPARSYADRIRGKIASGEIKVATETAEPEQEPSEDPHHARMRKAGVGRRFWDCSFSGYDPTRSRCGNKALEICQGYADGMMHMDGQGLFLVGMAGLGKTHLLASIIREIETRRTGSCRYITLEDYFVGLRSTFGARGQTERDYIDNLAVVPFLVLDDLGRLKSAESYEQRMLWYLLDKRYQAMSGTAMSTNLSVDELKKCFELRTLRRLEAEIVAV